MVTSEPDEKAWNSCANEIRPATVNVESTVTPWTTEPMKALRVNGLYLVSAWLMSALKKAF